MLPLPRISLFEPKRGLLFILGWLFAELFVAQVVWALQQREALPVISDATGWQNLEKWVGQEVIVDFRESPLVEIDSSRVEAVDGATTSTAPKIPTAEIQYSFAEMPAVIVPEPIKAEWESWASNVVELHWKNTHTSRTAMLAGTDFLKHKNQWYRQAIDPECERIEFQDLAKPPKFCFHGVVRGRIKELASGNFGVEAIRLAAFPSPTAVALNALKSRKSLIGRVFEESGSFNTELFLVAAKGSGDFEKRFQAEVLESKPNQENLLNIIATGTRDEITAANAAKLRQLEAFLGNFAKIKTTKEQLKELATTRIESRTGAEDAVRRIF